MKSKLLFIIFMIGTMLFSGCTKGPQQEIPFRGYITVPAGINTFLTHNFVIKNLPGVPTEGMVDARPAYVRLFVEEGEFSTDFIREAFLEATTNGSTIRREMAYRQDIPITNSRFLELFPSILDMKDHIGPDDFEVTLKLNLRSIPVTNTRIRVDFGLLATYEE
jgi:hypothetical protein